MFFKQLGLRVKDPARNRVETSGIQPANRGMDHQNCGLWPEKKWMYVAPVIVAFKGTAFNEEMEMCWYPLVIYGDVS